MKNKILGGLIGGAIGDAMGAATETRSLKQIKEKFNGFVTEILTPPSDVFARGFEKGSVTDDFSLAYYTALSIIQHEGVVDDKTAKDALLNWSKTKYYALAGPTTVLSVEKLKGNFIEDRYPFLTVDNSKASNGSAMKIAPCAYVSNGNLDIAIKNAITICYPTHYNSTSLSAACAIASSIAKVLQGNASINDIIDAGLYGAKEGEKYGAKLATASVYHRIKLAVQIGNKYKDDKEKGMEALANIIGSGLAASEAIPCVYGLLVLNDAKPMESIISAVNIGNDTDTIATMIGAIVGTLHGPEVFNKDDVKLIEVVNDFNLEKLAIELERVAYKDE